MSCLIANLPSQEVWVRKEYLTDHQSGHGEFCKRAFGCRFKSIPGRAFYFETYLPEYAAMYDKLPISAFVSRPEKPDPDMTLRNFTVLELYGLWCCNRSKAIHWFNEL